MRFSFTALLLAATSSVIADTKAIPRRPDSFWNSIVKGADIQNSGKQGGAHKRVDGQLANYRLRVRKNDPSQLGVDTVKQYSGYLDDDDEDKHLFYWFLESRNDPKNDPVVLWLNGGPGCSSLIGMFSENGPSFFPNPDGKPVNNPNSWNTNASVIFIDQPVNVGFSYSDTNPAKTSVVAGKDIYALLTLFFHEFPEYGKQDFFITGESYAGHYIPTFAHEILSHDNRNINLKGIAIGNGITDALTQYKYYQPMACGQGGQPSVLSKSDCQAMQNIVAPCTKRIQSCYDTKDADTCSNATDYCNSNIFGIYGHSGRSDYDVTSKTSGKVSYSDKFVNSNATQEALGVEGHPYDQCSGSVYNDFVAAGDWMFPIHLYVPDILKKIPVLIYAGDYDFICNWLGNRAWVNALEWPGKTAFNAAKTTELKTASGDDYGNVRSAQGLTFMQIYKAGHTVPEYQGPGSLDFLNRFTGGEWKA